MIGVQKPEWCGIANCRKVVSLTTQKKTRAPQDSYQPPFCPKWADRAQNSPNVVTPWPLHVYQIWSGSAAFCRTYSGKIDFSAQKVNTIYRVGQIKRGQCSFFRCSKARFRESCQFLAGEITVHLRTLISIKITHFSPQGATKANGILSSILAVYIIIFTLKRFY